MKKAIYLDYAATSPMYPEVVETMSEAMHSTFGNASSTHQFGRKSRGYLDEARIILASSIHAKPNEIILTSGGSESDNMAIIKTAEKFQSSGKHIITTNVEHQAVLKPMQYLEKRGFNITYLPVDQNGRVTAEQVATALTEETILVSIMFGNNEVGSVMPIAEIGESIKSFRSDIVFHTDAVQAYGSQEIDVQALNVDLLSVAAHKIGGPKGIGFLYCRTGIELPGLILGGEQETKRRAGTENIPAIIGFQKAVEKMVTEKESKQNDYLQLKRLLLEQLAESQVEYKINGSEKYTLPHIVSLYLPGVDAEKLSIRLDLAGIAVSIGSACTAGNVDPSHVLVALYGKDHPAISETIRVSFGIASTRKEVEQAAAEIAKIVHSLT